MWRTLDELTQQRKSLVMQGVRGGKCHDLEVHLSYDEKE